MLTLKYLLENVSMHWGEKYLLTSHPGIESEPSNSHAYTLHSSNTRSCSSSERARVFPIRPKDHRQLVTIWLKYNLPALPTILSPILGGTYTASLVRRGHFDIRAQPCIQIESPCIPGLDAQDIIKDSLRDIFNKDEHQPIQVRFVRGSARKLNGGVEEEDDAAGESADFQRLRFNFIRPYSRPGMGASLGLLCSRKIVGTLGGYILVDGQKYVLTSDHFVTESQEPANSDSNYADLDTLTSPSSYDLKRLENCLKQNKRDSDSVSIR